MAVSVALRRRIRLTVLTMCVALFVQGVAAAAPITWKYKGTVDFSLDPSELPLGTPVTFVLTFPDPDFNYLEHEPGVPDWAGSYAVVVDVTVAGKHIEIYDAYLEVNFDFFGYDPTPGSLHLRQFAASGPPLFGLELSGGGVCYDGCLDIFVAFGADPRSPTLPKLQPPDFAFSLYGGDESGQIGGPLVGFEGAAVVPEPALLVLLGGALAVALRARYS